MNSDFTNWQVPKWHKDFGKPEKELALLKTMCRGLSELNHKLRYNLDLVEEGYMRVLILFQGRIIGEVRVIDLEENKCALFTHNDDEFYFSESSCLLFFLKDCLSKQED